VKPPGSPGCAGVKTRQQMTFVSARGRAALKGVELYAQARFAVEIEGVSRREAARRFGIDPLDGCEDAGVFQCRRDTDEPAAGASEPDPFTGIIDRILREDEARPRKQRHTLEAIFERLRDEIGYAGGITVMKATIPAICRARPNSNRSSGNAGWSSAAQVLVLAT
jgi:hypothetical protein